MATQDKAEEDETLEWESLRLALVATDDEHKYWSPEVVNETKNNFIRLRGSIPSTATLEAHYGDRLLPMVRKILADRIEWLKLQKELDGKDHPCHCCGNDKDLSYHRFGLAMVFQKERDWKSTLVSATISAATLPILGMGALYGPSTSKSAHIMRMQLVLCEDCLDKKRGLFGGFKVKPEHAALHHMWEKVCEAGFIQFIDAHDLKTKWGDV
jgi:hypothetical protein